MIRVLDKFIADKIAAGEVIERPVSAVKELVENSIDAGASSVIVEIRGGGKSYIRVTDDGCGITPDEAETAFLRHATSKISSIADLDNIRSLGFRGEALASIAAVSRLTLVTRTADNNAGIRLIMHGGRTLSKETAGANKGTTIVAEDLFYNTPARRKFMGTDAREASAVIELIQQYAVCYPEIRFMMIRNGETVFSTAGDGDTLHTIQALYPDADHSGLITVTGQHVRGYVSDPGTTKSTRRGQLFFVNGRLVDSRIIEKGLMNGYGGRIFSGHPVAILFIQADPSEIDVNIHPGKREIKFLREADIVSDITAAVSAAMLSRESVPSGRPARDPFGITDTAPDISNGAPEPDLVSLNTDTSRMSAIEPLHDRDSRSPASSYGELADDPGYAGEQSTIREYLGSLKRPEPATLPASSGADAAGSDAPQAHTAAADLPESGASDEGSFAFKWMPQNTEPAPVRFNFDDLEYRGYLFDTYIVMQSADTVYLFDQHAAHERIFYEKFTSSYLSGDKLTQPVLTPVTINVSADVYYMSRDWLEPLTGAGYDIEDFGSGTFIIRGIPSFMDMSEAASFARAYLEGLEDHSGRNDTVIDKLIMRSCKSAVKAGEHLSALEIDRLIQDLAKCSNPYCCPHGRPTFIRYSKYEIERSFRRK